MVVNGPPFSLGMHLEQKQCLSACCSILPSIISNCFVPGVLLDADQLKPGQGDKYAVHFNVSVNYPLLIFVVSTPNCTNVELCSYSTTLCVHIAFTVSILYSFLFASKPIMYYVYHLVRRTTKHHYVTKSFKLNIFLCIPPVHLSVYESQRTTCVTRF